MRQLGIAPTGVGEADDAREAHGHASDEKLSGIWASEVRQTILGLLNFEFTFRDGWFEVIGVTPEMREEAYRRSGPYRIEGKTLVSSAINEGRPVDFHFEEGELVLKIEDVLRFRLKRK